MLSEPFFLLQFNLLGSSASHKLWKLDKSLAGTAARLRDPSVCFSSPVSFFSNPLGKLGFVSWESPT